MASIYDQLPFMGASTLPMNLTRPPVPGVSQPMQPYQPRDGLPGELERMLATRAIAMRQRNAMQPRPMKPVNPPVGLPFSGGTAMQPITPFERTGAFAPVSPSPMLPGVMNKPRTYTQPVRSTVPTYNGDRLMGY